MTSPLTHKTGPTGCRTIGDRGLVHVSEVIPSVLTRIAEEMVKRGLVTPERTIEALVAERDALRDTLATVLPMAKGYAATHCVGRNAEMIQEAEALLAGSRP